MVRKIHWTKTSFFITTTLIAIMGLFFWIINPNKNVYLIWFAVIYGAIIELCITAGYHRLFSHRSYKTNALIRFFYLFFGAGAFQGPAIYWASTHRNHHLYTDDTEKDPHSIKKGFWWAHIVWLFYRGKSEIDCSNCQDLQKDILVKLQCKYYLPIAIFVCFIIPLLFGFIWGAPLETLLIAGFLRLVINHHVTFSINSLTHMIGKQTYSKKHSARDNWLTALLTFGEGYHNFHHEFPSDYRNGIRFYHWDPSKWFINFLSKINWAWDLKRTSPELILLKKNYANNSNK